MARKKSKVSKKASRKNATAVEVEEKTEDSVDEDQEVLDAIKKAEAAVERSEARKAEDLEEEVEEVEETEAEVEEAEAEVEEAEAEVEEAEAEVEEAELEEPEAELEAISEIEDEIDGTSEKEADEDVIGIAEMSQLLQRSEMRCKKFCRDELSQNGGAKKEGGSWKISRKAVEELSTQIERYTLTFEDVAKRLEIDEEEVQKLIDGGILKAETKDDKTLISKKSVSFYEKKED